MREIKFRAWDKEKKEMGKPFGIYCTLLPLIYRETKIIMQFTGLKDKNRKEIFEGDVVEMFFNDKKGIVKGIIEWKQEECEFIINVDWTINDGSGGATYCTLGHYLLKNNKFDKVEIIGNIYENPELLEKTK